MASYIVESGSIDFEYDTFRPNNANVTQFGLEELESRYFRPEGNGIYREIFANDVFRRRGSIASDDTFTPLEGAIWEYVGTAGVLSSESHRRVRIRELTEIAPGENMSNPLGMSLWSADGPRLVRPASGEQDLDPWTGEPLVDENGDPVLVP